MGARFNEIMPVFFLTAEGNWEIVKKAFKQGLIDEIQAYAR